MSKSRTDLRNILLFCGVYALLTLMVGNSYYLLIMTIVPIWAVMGLSWNLFSGYSGLISFGHAAFFGLGAYWVALSLQLWQLSPWISIVLAGVLGAIAGALIALPTFRLRGHYFALAMLAYPSALLYIFEWLGYQEVALPMHREQPWLYLQFADQRIYVGIALMLLLLTLLLNAFLVRTRFGLSLLAIKQNTEAAEAAGIDTRYWLTVALILSAALAGIAGGFYAVVLLVVTPLAVFGMLVSAQALVIAMFGGVGTLWGPVLGAVLLVPASELLHARFGTDFPGIQGVIYGLAIIAVIILAPEGLIWKLQRFRVGGATTVQGTTNHGFLPDAPVALLNCSRQVSDTPILEVRQLGKSFGGLQATTSLDFSVKRGELLGIIGPNGAGKTTLFNLLNGFIRPDTGAILFEGVALKGLKPNQICRKGIARTFQVARPFPRLSVFDNVLVGALGNCAHTAEAALHASAALKQVGLQDKHQEAASALNNAELRLLELARALASRPALILVDEILAGLDSAASAQMESILRALVERGLTVVIIEHSMQSMVKLVDRFIVLDHGALLAQGLPQDIVRHPDVIAAYLGKKWLAHADTH